MKNDHQPILVGCAQLVIRDFDPENPQSPLDLLERVARRALSDMGADAGEGISEALDGIAVIRLFSDTSPRYASPFGGCANLPKSLARRLGAITGRHLYGPIGGNTPQWMIGQIAGEIAEGRTSAFLIAGAEAMRTTAMARKAGLDLDWSEDTGDAPGNDQEDEPEQVGDLRMGISPEELKYGLGAPAHTYPLFENALQAHYRRTGAEHRTELGRMMAGLSEIAALNPYAALPLARSPAEIITPAPDNRMVSWPYTKYMVSNDRVDQAAAILMMSVARARKMGIPKEKWVYLHGCADVNDKWLLSGRVNYHSSPAIKLAADKALEMAGIGIGDIDIFDLYSCFPCAIEMTCDALGIAPDDRRGLTVTGGLPYFGGPGNNYALHGIATMMERLRARPGSFGLTTAVGWYMTKHAIGIYSTSPPGQPFTQEDPATSQREIDAMTSPELIEIAEGPATIETFTVVHDRDGPTRGIIIGRLDENGKRFLANTAPDLETLNMLMAEDVVGRKITVTHRDGLNVVRLE